MTRVEYVIAMRELGFTQYADGLKDWVYFAYPGLYEPVFARVTVQLFLPKKELNVRIHTGRKPRAVQVLQDEVSGYVKNLADAEKLISPFLRKRFLMGALLFAQYRPNDVPREFCEAIAHNDDGIAQVIADWLLEHGFQF
jgi:hypothetical protein